MRAAHSGAGTLPPSGTAEKVNKQLTKSKQIPLFLQELTEKGLKKLQDSTDNSYLNIQRLVLKYLHAVSQSINFILFELEGMSTNS